MFQFDGLNGQFSTPLAPPRDRLATIPCDLTEYARAQTGPRSWSAAYENDRRELTLDDPFADLFFASEL